MTARIYVEGGGDRRQQQAQLREAFAKLFDKAGFKRPRAPTVVCAGSRNNAYRDFCNALRQHGDAAMLLVDSEGAARGEPWAHVSARDQWPRPAGAADDQLHLMVEMMENWFLADRDALARYFGKGFAAQHLPGTADAVEAIAKAAVESGLKRATSPSHKGDYTKGRHSADLLQAVDPATLRHCAPHFEKLMQAIAARLR